jgi:hypothetical protein
MTAHHARDAVLVVGDYIVEPTPTDGLRRTPLVDFEHVLTWLDPWPEPEPVLIEAGLARGRDIAWASNRPTPLVLNEVAYEVALQAERLVGERLAQRERHWREVRAAEAHRGPTADERRKAKRRAQRLARRRQR